MSLIKLISVDNRRFIYDSKTNMLSQIDDAIDISIEENQLTDEEISKILGRNYSQNDAFEIVPPLDFKSLKYLVEHNCSQLVMSITEHCNMRCEYCGYHERNVNIAEKKEMSSNIAKKAIRMFLERSIALSEVVISFYGGEPLLRFDLIDECVEYAKKTAYGQHIKFHVTTNGLLLTDKITEYLKRNDFVVAVSLDGPRSIHNRYRRNIKNEETYDNVIDNLKSIYFKYPEYFCNNIIFMPVYAPPKNDQLLFEFFENMPINYMLGPLYVTPYFKTILDSIDTSCEIILPPAQKAQFKKYNRINLDSLYKYREMFNRHNEIKSVFPAGNCIPACKKIYVNAGGEIYLCEKVEESERNCIGNINNGIDVYKVYMQYEHMKNMYESIGCQTCWAVHYCSICFRDFGVVSEERCRGIRRRVENEIKDSIREWCK